MGPACIESALQQGIKRSPGRVNMENNICYSCQNEDNMGNHPSREMMISTLLTLPPMFHAVFQMCHQAYLGVAILSANKLRGRKFCQSWFPFLYIISEVARKKTLNGF